MERSIEIQNQINQVQASIEQMENSPLFNEMQKRDNLEKLNDELARLQSLKIIQTNTNSPEAQF